MYMWREQAKQYKSEKRKEKKQRKSQLKKARSQNIILHTNEAMNYILLNKLEQVSNYYT